jgi:hypothetical protein
MTMQEVSDGSDIFRLDSGPYFRYWPGSRSEAPSSGRQRCRCRTSKKFLRGAGDWQHDLLSAFADFVDRGGQRISAGHKQTGSALHKNIAYRPREDRINGLDKAEATAAVELRRILREYAQNCAEFLSRFLVPYAGKWKLDFASFRPIEEGGRAARLHARNDLLHFDSFPTRPTNGARILRFFHQHQSNGRSRLADFGDVCVVRATSGEHGGHHS